MYSFCEPFYGPEIYEIYIGKPLGKFAAQPLTRPLWWLGLVLQLGLKWVISGFVGAALRLSWDQFNIRDIDMEMSKDWNIDGCSCAINFVMWPDSENRRNLSISHVEIMLLSNTVYLFLNVCVCVCQKLFLKWLSNKNNICEVQKLRSCSILSISGQISKDGMCDQYRQACRHGMARHRDAIPGDKLQPVTLQMSTKIMSSEIKDD